MNRRTIFDQPHKNFKTDATKPDHILLEGYAPLPGYQSDDEWRKCRSLSNVIALWTDFPPQYLQNQIMQQFRSCSGWGRTQNFSKRVRYCLSNYFWLAYCGETARKPHKLFLFQRVCDIAPLDPLGVTPGSEAHLFLNFQSLRKLLYFTS